MSGENLDCRALNSAQKRLVRLTIANKLDVQKLNELKQRINQNQFEISKLKDFVSTYESLVSISDSEDLLLYADEKADPNLSNKEKIRSLAEVYLRQRSPINTLGLLALLEKDGIEVGGKNKAVYLSNVLSTSSLFVARRKFGGWFLTEQDPTPQKENLGGFNTEVSNINQASLAAGTNSDGLSERGGA